MNAPANGFSEASYLADRRELEQQLAAAKAKFNETSLKLHSGEISEEDAAKIAAEPELIRMKIRGLDAAWEEHVRLEEAKAHEAEREALKSAAAEAREHEAAAQDAFAAIDEYLAGAAPLVEAYNAEIGDLDHLHRAHQGLLGREGTGEALQSLRDRDRERLKLEARIFEVLGSFGMGNRQVWMDWRDKDAEFVIAFKSRVVDALVHALRRAAEKEQH
jgi:hypothetical protein